MNCSAWPTFFAFLVSAKPKTIESGWVAPGGSMKPYFQVAGICLATSAVTQLPFIRKRERHV